MGIIINPGSGALQVDETWQNTEQKALENVMNWFVKPIKKQGFTDIELINLRTQDQDGRYRFMLRHKITNVSVDIECHGITDLKAYEDKYIFTPRVYYNGSSGSNPAIEDFKADGYRPVITYVAAPDQAEVENE